jgi:hypothetical protein
MEKSEKHLRMRVTRESRRIVGFSHTSISGIRLEGWKNLEKHLRMRVTRESRQIVGFSHTSKIDGWAQQLTSYIIY